MYPAICRPKWNNTQMSDNLYIEGWKVRHKLFSWFETEMFLKNYLIFLSIFPRDLPLSYGLFTLCPVKKDQLCAACRSHCSRNFWPVMHKGQTSHRWSMGLHSGHHAAFQSFSEQSQLQQVLVGSLCKFIASAFKEAFPYTNASLANAVPTVHQRPC